MIYYRTNTNIFFFTATIVDWVQVFHDNDNKMIVVNSLLFLTKENRVKILGFVIMPNHIHLIWQIINPHSKSSVQRDFLKYTAQQIKFRLQKTNNSLLDKFFVGSKDRKYNIWQRNAYSFELDNIQTFIQKLNYIHNNPLQEKRCLSNSPEEYLYSSAKFYKEQMDDFGFLTHYSEIF